MKKSILLLFGLLFIASYVKAQVIENFDKAGSLGIFKDAVWGTTVSPSITDSIYQTTDPTGKSAGVMGVSFDLKGYDQHNAIRPVTQGWLDPKGAQQLTYYIYIPANSTIPDSIIFGLWWQVNGNWAWNEYDYYAKDIPKGVWYPLSIAILDSSIADPTNDGFVNSHIFGDFGIQWNNDHAQSVVWKGDVYVDNVSLQGAKPKTYADFTTGLQGASFMWHNGWVDSVHYVNQSIGGQTGAIEIDLLDGSAKTGGTSVGFQPVTAFDASSYNFIAFWVYVDTSFPSSAYMQVWAQDNSLWNWPGKGITTYNGSSIPKNVWFPVYMDIAQASILDAGISGSEFNSTKYPLGKWGIQVDAPAAWTGKIFIQKNDFLNSIVATPAKWVAANFDNAANGIQGFYVPTASYDGTLVRSLGIGGNTTFVLKAGVDFSKSHHKFGMMRDTVPLLDVTDPSLYATAASFDVYFPPDMPAGADFQMVITGAATKNAWTQSDFTVDNQSIKTGQWNTITMNYDALVQKGTIDPSKTATIGVQIAYYGSLDTTTWAGSIYFDNFTLYGITNGGRQLATQVTDKAVIKEFRLYNNYPNPFNPSTIIRYDLPGDLNVTLKVYDVLGQEVETLVNNQRQSAGSYSIQFNASRLASGMYVYRITAGNYVESYKMMLLK